ncbi:MAG: putative sulfate exporter family transporter [Muribaculaceae bacterium]|nr:putative sulfate exporter family transporter [Muribaculaceae bacterium]
MDKIKIVKIVFVVLFVVSFLLTPALALFLGILLSLTMGTPYPKITKKVSKYMLQISVVGLGFGMNLHESLQAGKEGMLYTIISVVGVMLLGVFLGKLLNINRKNSYLISSGTAICGGSAIAAVAPVIDADDNDTSLALITIFVLNAVALFVFPVIGGMLELTQQQFGTWAAIAIHDTSSVVGAGAAYGDEALKVATTIKLTRALWIIPLAFISAFVFRTKGKRPSIPWFILLFVVAMLINTYLPLPQIVTENVVFVAKKLMTVTLYLIGCGLSVSALKKVGVKPMLLGVILWVIISITTLFVVML